MFDLGPGACIHLPNNRPHTRSKSSIAKVSCYKRGLKMLLCLFFILKPALGCAGFEEFQRLALFHKSKLSLSLSLSLITTRNLFSKGPRP